MTNSATGLLSDIINGLSLSNPNFLSVLIPVLIAQVFGFAVYVYAILIEVREKNLAIHHLFTRFFWRWTLSV